MIRSATVHDAARLTDLWRAAELMIPLRQRCPASGGWHDIQPDLSAEPYVFATGEPPPGGSPFAVIREDEGVTVILTRADADRAGLPYDYVAARITLRVGSALTDVGLTAASSRTLADAGISCNVIAGLAHDHLFVTGTRPPRPSPGCASYEYRRGRVLG